MSPSHETPRAWIAIDTSLGASVARVEAGATVSRDSTTDARGHAERLAPMLAPLLAAGPIDAIAVGIGPAPFTGLRVGIVTARALSAALDVPLVGVCVLDVLARQACDAGAAQVTAVTDARRREVFVGAYRPAGADDVERLGELAVAVPTDVPVSGATLVGSGTRLYPDVLPGTDPEIDLGVMVRLAAHRWGTAQPTEPLYLRRPDIHASTGRKRATT